MKYIIDYNTGITEEFVGTLSGAKAEADKNICYTQQNIDILDENDSVVATRKWWGVQYDENNEDMYEEDPISYGKFGYYSSWIEY